MSDLKRMYHSSAVEIYKSDSLVSLFSLVYVGQLVKRSIVY